MTLNLPSSSISLRSELLTGSDSETEIEEFIYVSPLRVWQTDSQGACYFVGDDSLYFCLLPHPLERASAMQKGEKRHQKRAEVRINCYLCPIETPI